MHLVATEQNAAGQVGGECGGMAGPSPETLRVLPAALVTYLHSEHS